MNLRVDVAGLDRLRNMLAAAGEKAPVAISRALNHTGAKANTQVIRALTAQTGLKRRVIVKAVKKTPSTPTTLAFKLAASGGNIRVRFFSPKETRPGVVAKPRGASTLFPGAFMKGGRFPNRKPITNRLTGGGVYERVGGRKWPVREARSGVFIPEEMVEGASRAAFLAVAQRDLPARIGHELARILGA